MPPPEVPTSPDLGSTAAPGGRNEPLGPDAEQIHAAGYETGFRDGRADKANDLDLARIIVLRDAARGLHRGVALGEVGICAPDCPGCALVRRADEIEDAEVPLDGATHGAGGSS